MTDIVERLRRIERAGDIAPDGHVPLAAEAADEIERLRAALIGHGRACFSEAREMADEAERLRLQYFQWEITVNQKDAEIKRLRTEVANAQAMCDSYAKENQQFHDEIERLRAEIAAVVREREDWNGKHQEACIEIERLRAALRACIKSAEADDPLKESGWWDEQSIVAIEQARKLLGEVLP